MNSKANEIKLDIKSKQVENSKLNTDFNEIVHSAEGKHYRKAGKDYIIYEEKSLEGMEGSTAHLRIEEDKLIMKRSGSIETRMEFIENEETNMNYKCPEGVMCMTVFTERMELKREDNGSINSILVDYVLNFDGGYKTYNSIVIDIDYK